MRTSLADRIRLPRELLAFGVVGAAAFAVQMGLFDSLGRSGIGPLTANATSVVFATAVAFVGNRYWAFRHKRGALLREAVSFAAINAVTFVLSEAVLALAYPLGVAHDRLATDALAVAGIVAASSIRFLTYRGTVFRGPSPVAAYARRRYRSPRPRRRTQRTAVPVASTAPAYAATAAAFTGASRP